MSIKDRLLKLRQSLAEKEIEAILISQPENRYYLSGFDGSAGYLLIDSKHTILATDFRYIEQAKRQSPDYEIFQIIGGFTDWFPKLTSEMNLKKLGFEASHITFATYRQLSEILNNGQSQLKLVPTDGMVETLRAIKEPEEIAYITEAAALTDAAFVYIEDKVQSGITELEIAWGIEKFLREKGSQILPFDVIVCAGANAALPHAKPSQHKIGAGESVVIDIGARVGGYASDLTRTICPGADDSFNKIYDVVLGAELTAIALITEGINGEEADRLARTVIEEAGYGEAFGHGLGHGVGLAIHEQPRLGAKSSDQLKSGMVFSIEPGIYLKDWGGVRIEDLVTIEYGKVKVLSKARKT